MRRMCCRDVIMKQTVSLMERKLVMCTLTSSMRFSNGDSLGLRRQGVWMAPTSEAARVLEVPVDEVQMSLPLSLSGPVTAFSLLLVVVVLLLLLLLQKTPLFLSFIMHRLDRRVEDMTRDGVESIVTVAPSDKATLPVPDTTSLWFDPIDATDVDMSSQHVTKS